MGCLCNEKELTDEQKYKQLNLIEMELSFRCLCCEFKKEEEGL